ncbi:MAG TPA: putative porin, partial [bacterium]
MKRFWMTAFLLIGLFAVMVAPVAAKSGDENGSDQESMDALKDDVNSGLGSLASRVSTIEKALEIKFFGDVRGRYAFQSQSQSDPTDAAALNTGVTTISDNIKGRYRARFGVKKETGDIMGGMRISTGQIGVNGATAGNSVLQSNPNSENQTFSNGFGDPGIIIDQAYLTYEPSFLDKHLKVTVGKMPNPLTATPMTWDPDITPEGWMLELSKDEFKFRATYFDLVNNAGAALTSFGGFLNTRAADDEYMANFQMSRMFQFDKDTSATLTAGYEYIPNGTALVGGALNGFFLGPKG